MIEQEIAREVEYCFFCDEQIEVGEEFTWRESGERTPGIRYPCCALCNEELERRLL